MARVRFFIAVCLLALAACREKKAITLSGDEPVEVSDFIAFFEPVSLPFQAGDTILGKKDNDSLRISTANFNRYIPDSMRNKWFGKQSKPKVYAMGKAAVSNAETYLFVKTVHAGKKSIIVLAFDKDQQFRDGLVALQPDKDAGTTQAFSMDRRHTVTKSVQRKNKDGTISDGKDVYWFNPENGHFMLIMTEALDEKVTELINPVDTLPRKHKYAADYGSGKMNLVSIRDGRRAGRIRFFIHIEKNNGACSGELKGEAFFRKPHLAEYREAGDPCVLQFIFTNGAVTLKELEGCGARRGLECSFNGSYPKKRTPKTSVKTKKKTTKQ